MLSEDLQKELDIRRGLRPALLCAFNPRSPAGDRRAALLPCAPVLWCLGVLAGAGRLPRRLDFRSVCTGG